MVHEVKNHEFKVKIIQFLKKYIDTLLFKIFIKLIFLFFQIGFTNFSFKN